MKDRDGKEGTPENLTHLAHELGDDAVEDGPLVAKPFLAGAETTEVLCVAREESQGTR